MSDSTKTVIIIDGKEVKVETGGKNTVVKNFGVNTIYASASPNFMAGADGVAEIQDGEEEIIYGTNGTVYLLGTGRVCRAQCTGIS